MGDEDGRAPFVLGPITLGFDAGEIVIITGANGSGKTTLAKILCGLYKPEEGFVALDGEPIEAGDREAFRQHFAAVFADFHLFKHLLGLHWPAVETAARRDLARLHLAHKIEIDDGEFSSLNLSQGQRKRLALLVARLEDRSVYVFDEWAADQDREFREQFYETVLPEFRAGGKTVFVISHDERYFHVADRVLKLESGQVCSDTRVARTPAVQVDTMRPAHALDGAAAALGPSA
jgi:putative ATP-binding cassette transporter